MLPKEQLPLTPDQVREYDRLATNAPLTANQITSEITGKNPRVEGRRATGSVASRQILANIDRNAAERRAREEELGRKRSEASMGELTDLLRSNK